MALISVIIPVCGGSPFLPRAIDSVLGQTFKDLEVIVVNNGFSDCVENVIKEYNGANLRRIKIEGGIARTINAAIQSSRGEYICWLNPEDYFLPYKITAQVEFFKDKPHVEICYADAYIATPNLVIDYWSSEIDRKLPVFLGLLKKNFIQSSTVMIKRECFEKVGFLDESWKDSFDFDWFLRASHVCSFGRIDYPTARVSYSKNQDHPEERTIVLRALKLLEKRENFPTGFSSRVIADVFLKRRMFKEAEKEYVSILTNNGYSEDNLLGLGRSYLGQSLFRKALEAFKKVIEVNPDYIDALYHLGLCCNRLGLQEEANDYCNRVIEIEPDHSADIYNLKAMALLHMGKTEEAKKALKEGLDLEPLDLSQIFETGKILIEHKLYEEALYQFERVNEFRNIFILDELQIYAYYYRGLCLFKLNDFREAVAAFSQVVSYGHKTAEIFDYLARAMVNMGWGPSAVEMWRLAIEKDPSYLKNHFHLIWYYLRKGNTGLWQEHLKRLILRGITNIEAIETMQILGNKPTEEVDSEDIWKKLVSKPVKRILIIRSAPIQRVSELIQNLKERFSQAHITLLIQPSIQSKLTENSNVDLVLGLREGKFNLSKFPFTLMVKIIRKRYDLFIIPYNNLMGVGYSQINIFALISGARNIIGINPEDKLFILNFGRISTTTLKIFFKYLNRFSKVIMMTPIVSLLAPIMLVSFLKSKTTWRIKGSQ